MKKHIVLIQSLLLLSLVSTPLLFGMDQTNNWNYYLSNEDALEDAFKNALGEKYFADDEGDLAISVGSLFGEEPSTPLTTSTMLNAIDKEMDLLNAKADLIDTKIAALENKQTVAVETPDEVVKMANLKQEKFENLHNQLLSNPLALLTTPEITKTTDPASAEYLALVEKHNAYDNLLNTIKSNTAALKKTPEITKTTETTTVEDWIKPYQNWIEKYEQFQKTLPELLNNKKPLISVGSKTIDLSQSMMAVPMPTKKGLEGWLYTYSFTKKAHNLIHDALIDGMFDPHNETHVQYLENALEFYVTEGNAERLMSMLEICQHHIGTLDITEKVARKVHNFLENITAEQEKETKLIVEKKSAEFVATHNALVIAFQEEMAKRTKELEDKLDQYGTDCDNTLSAKADYIRSLKKGTANVHGIKPQLKHAKNEPCSDKIKCLSSTHNKVYMTQVDVDAIYTDQYLLRKIESDKSVITLLDNTRDVLQHISAIQKATQGVKLLTQ